MKKILIPTDFSDNAKHALFYGLTLFDHWEEPVAFDLFHAFVMANPDPEIPVFTTDHITENINQAFSFLKDDIKANFPNSSIDVVTEFGIGTVDNTVSAIIEHKDIDLVVMGTRGVTGLESVLLGSNTGHLVKKAICPVLVVPEKSPIKPPSKMVLAIDHPDSVTRKMLDPFLKIARKFNAEIILLHVVGNQNEGKVHLDHDLKDFLEGLEFAQYLVFDPDVPHGIEHFIESQHASIVGIISKHLSIFDRIFNPSIAKNLALHTEIPVLVMPVI